jgi:hypothetical protein
MVDFKIFQTIDLEDKMCSYHTCLEYSIQSHVSTYGHILKM